MQNSHVSVDVGIIGGGVIGWSCAYYLAKTNAGLSIKVYEKEASSGLGATNKAAGGVRAQFGSRVNIQLSLFSIEEFKKMPAQIGFKQFGYLFLTSSEHGANQLEKARQLQSDCGVRVVAWGKDEILQKAPYLNSGDIVSANFSHSDGFLDPFSVCKVFESSAKKLGVKAVFSKKSNIEDCKRIVIASGQWSREVARDFGIDLPVFSKKHQLAIAEPAHSLPLDIPMIVDFDTSFHFRREGDGILIGFNCEPETESDNFEYSFLERLAEPGLNRLPALEKMGFDKNKCWAGFYAETPDQHAIIDILGDVFVCTGFGGHGIMHSPAAGKAIAELFCYGECKSFDIKDLRLSRFAENQLNAELMVI